jgi:hypothetical protein
MSNASAPPVDPAFDKLVHDRLATMSRRVDVYTLASPTNEIFTSLWHSTLPDVPHPNAPGILYYGVTAWVQEGSSALCFWPQDFSKFEGDVIFETLASDRPALSKMDDGRFIARKVEDWKPLEKTLFTIIDILRTDLIGEDFDGVLLQASRPSALANYTQPRASREEAAAVARQARAALIYAACLVSLLIALLWDETANRDRWYELLAHNKHHTFEPRWLDRMKRSAVNIFDEAEVPRVGVFIDPLYVSLRYLNHLPGMILAKIKVFIMWSNELKDEERERIERLYDTLGPRMDSVQAFVSQPNALPSYSRPPTRRLPLVAQEHAYLRDTAMREVKSGQRLARVHVRDIGTGEAIGNYLDYRLAVQARLWDMAAPGDRDRMTRAQEHVRARKSPGPHQSMVIWMKKRSGHGFFVVHVPRDYIDVVWSYHPPWEFRYESATCQWICAAFWPGPPLGEKGRRSRMVGYWASSTKAEYRHIEVVEGWTKEDAAHWLESRSLVLDWEVVEQVRRIRLADVYIPPPSPPLEQEGVPGFRAPTYITTPGKAILAQKAEQPVYRAPWSFPAVATAGSSALPPSAAVANNVPAPPPVAPHAAPAPTPYDATTGWLNDVPMTDRTTPPVTSAQAPKFWSDAEFDNLYDDDDDFGMEDAYPAPARSGEPDPLPLPVAALPPPSDHPIPEPAVAPPAPRVPQGAKEHADPKIRGLAMLNTFNCSYGMVFPWAYRVYYAQLTMLRDVQLRDEQHRPYRMQPRDVIGTVRPRWREFSPDLCLKDLTSKNCTVSTLLRAAGRRALRNNSDLSKVPLLQQLVEDAATVDLPADVLAWAIAFVAKLSAYGEEITAKCAPDLHPPVDRTFKCAPPPIIWSLATANWPKHSSELLGLNWMTCTVAHHYSPSERAPEPTDLVKRSASFGKASKTGKAPERDVNLESAEHAANSDVWIFRIKADPMQRPVVLFDTRCAYELARGAGAVPLSFDNVVDMLLSNLVHHALPLSRVDYPLLSHHEPLATEIESARKSTCTIGWRKPNYKFTSQDFGSYRDSVRSYVSQHPEVLRAGIQKGGIVGRVLYEYLPDNAGRDRPSVSAEMGVAQGFFDMSQGDGGHWLLEDKLLPEEEQAILGQYLLHVEKGDVPSAPSWFPSSAIFQSSPLNTGFWTPECEAWYLSLVNDYSTTCEKQPRTGPKWNSAMRNLGGAELRYVQAALRYQTDEFLHWAVAKPSPPVSRPVDV